MELNPNAKFENRRKALLNMDMLPKELLSPEEIEFESRRKLLISENVLPEDLTEEEMEYRSAMEEEDMDDSSMREALGPNMEDFDVGL